MENYQTSIKKPAIVGASTERPPLFENVRQELLAFHSKNEELDIKRVDDFLREKGLNVRELVIFGNEDVSEINRILRPLDLCGFDTASVTGFFISEIDMVFVRRPQGAEQDRSTRMESDLVHEQAHASGQYHTFIEMEDGFIFSPRSGFGLPMNEIIGDGGSWGAFLEEGFAEMMAGEYAKKFLTEKEKMEMAEHMGLHDVPSVDSLFEAKTSAGTLLLPFKHVYPRRDSFNYSYAAPAAFALELLCRKSPELYQTLISARTDIESLRKIPKLINGIKEGLYTRLMGLPNAAGFFSSGAFNDGLKIVIDEVYGGKVPMNDKNEQI